MCRGDFLSIKLCDFYPELVLIQRKLRVFEALLEILFFFSGGEMMMCFLAGPEMKFPQNSFELQVEFFEVKLDL